MDLQTFSALTRNGMFEHLSAAAKKLGREELARGKSRARKEVLVAAYAELLQLAPEPGPEAVAYPETLCVPETLPAPPELPEIDATYQPVPGPLHAPDLSGSVTQDQVTHVASHPAETATRPSVRVRLTDGHGQRRLPHGATTSAELQRARVAKKQRNRRKHKKALASRRNGWPNGIGSGFFPKYSDAVMRSGDATRTTR